MHKNILKLIILTIAFFVLSAPAWAYNQNWSNKEDITLNVSGNSLGLCRNSNCKGTPCKVCTTHSPVYLKTGHFNWDDIDITLPGSPFISLSRSYTSHDPINGLFGNGWISNVERSLIKTVKSTIVNNAEVKTTYYIFRHEYGKRYTFKVAEDGSIKAPKGLFQSIKANDDGSYVFLYKNGNSETYKDGNLILKEDKNGNKIYFTYDNQGLLQQISDDNNRYLNFYYGANGYVSAITDNANRTWEYEHDTNGNLIAVTNPLHGVRRYEYKMYSPPHDAQVYYHLTKIIDETGRVVTSVNYNGEVVKTYTKGANTYNYTFNFANRTANKQDSMGSKYGVAWNSAGFIIQQINPLGKSITYNRNDDQITTDFADQAGNLWSKTVDNQGRVLTRTSPLGFVTKYFYEGDNPGPVKIKSPLGNETLLSYDDNYNLISLTNAKGAVYTFAYDNRGNIKSITDALGNTTEIIYNDLSLPVIISDPLGRTTKMSYDILGRIISTTDAEDRTFLYTYDNLDRVIQTIDGLGNKVSYTYDASGRLLSLTDPAGNKTSYTYDIHGRLVTKTLPDSSVISTKYRKDNLVESITRTDGKVISFTYDATKHLLSTSVDGNDTISYTYGPTGALIQAQNAQTVVKFNYDSNGRLIEELQDDISVKTDYDSDSNRIKLTYLDQIINYTRNSIGQATKISNAIDSFSFNYNENGFKTATLFPNGINEQLSFNAAYELTGISSDRGTINYTHDKSGRVTLKNINGQNIAYTYDVIARLTGSGNTNYSYDAAGNNLQNSSVYNTKTNELKSNADFDYSYDNAGNLISKSNKVDGSYKTYTWNSRNQLLSVKSYNSQNELTQELSFTYGPLGRRLTKTADGVTRKYLYDGVNIIAVMDKDNVVLSTILHGESIDTPLTITTDNNSYYYHRDHQGNILALTDSSKEEVENYSYNAYGVTSHTQTITTNNPYAYTGREYDDDDLYYYRARYYDPSTQRFLSRDPIGFASGDFNLYRYVLNDPVNLVDPHGLLNFSYQVSSMFVDIAVPLWDSNTGFFGSPSFGVSSTLVGGGLIISSDNSCPNDTYVDASTGISKYSSIGANQDLDKIHLTIGTGIGLPGLNYSASMQNFVQGLGDILGGATRRLSKFIQHVVD